MKEIAAHQHKFDLLPDGVPSQNIDPRVEEITRALSQLISRASEMHIGDMKELHTGILPYARSGLFHHSEAVDGGIFWWKNPARGEIMSLRHFVR
jgi:hypothetical protein